LGIVVSLGFEGRDAAKAVHVRRATLDASLEPADRSTPGHPQGQS
jgi:hypothetical protein